MEQSGRQTQGREFAANHCYRTMQNHARLLRQTRPQHYIVISPGLLECRHLARFEVP